MGRIFSQETSWGTCASVSKKIFQRILDKVPHTTQKFPTLLHNHGQNCAHKTQSSLVKIHRRKAILKKPPLTLFRNRADELQALEHFEDKGQNFPDEHDRTHVFPEFLMQKTVEELVIFLQEKKKEPVGKALKKMKEAVLQNNILKADRAFRMLLRIQFLFYMFFPKGANATGLLFLHQLLRQRSPSAKLSSVPACPAFLYSQCFSCFPSARKLEIPMGFEQ